MNDTVCGKCVEEHYDATFSPHTTEQTGNFISCRSCRSAVTMIDGTALCEMHVAIRVRVLRGRDD